MNKLSIVVSGLHYGVSIMGYFIRALKRREDVDLFTVGPFFGNWMPWSDKFGKAGIYIPQKYVVTPDVALPREASKYHIHPQMLVDKLPKKIDLWLGIDAGWHFATRPFGDVVALVQTDPHVLKPTYELPQSYSDYSFCMQSNYMNGKDIHLPYAYDPTMHYPMALNKQYDACMLGLLYDHRLRWIAALRKRGLEVYYQTGEVFDEYRERYNQSALALSWSSMQDTPARTFEALAMGVPLVANRTPDLLMYFKEGEHFLGFDNLDDGVEKVMWATEHPMEVCEMAKNGLKAVKEHTYDARIQTILEKVGLV